MRHVRLGTAAAAVLIALAGCDTARNLEEGAPIAECARCHGFPPASPHPSVASNAAACSVCHSTTVDSNGNIIAGGTHQNGHVDVTVAHPIPFVADHPAAALADIASCKGCHGADYTGGSSGVSCTGCHTTTPGIADWTTNCTFCHGARTASVTTATAAAAPPVAVVRTGDQTNANPKVGAHQAHLNAGTFATALACGNCHTVPDTAAALTHFTGSGAQAPITFSATATKGVTGAAYAGAGGTCAVYCHGSGTELANAAGKTSPAWTSTSIACGDCHGLPPDSGPKNAVLNNQTAHQFHVTTMAIGCGTCHSGYTSSSVDTTKHVNGTKDVVVQLPAGGTQQISGWDCSNCHAALGIAFVHTVPFVAQHTSVVFPNIAACTTCHGADYGGGTSGVSCNACHATVLAGDWKTNCTFCHGTRTPNFAGTPVWLPAPPQTVVVTADQTTANPRIGAHQKHVGNGSALSNGVACTECHPAATDLTHIGGSGTAQLVNTGPLASNAGATVAITSGTCTSYCHGATLPAAAGRTAPTWAPPTALNCGSCHEANPTTNRHPAAPGSPHSFMTTTTGCATCHGSGFTAGTSVNKAHHVDGAVFKDPSLIWLDSPKSCAPACHGSLGRQNW